MKKAWLVVLTVSLTGCTSAYSQPEEIEGSIEAIQPQVQGISERSLPEGLQDLPEEYQRLTVPYLRTLAYPGSDIEMVRQVADEATYTSYLTSYKSEDLRIQGLLTIPKGDAPPGGFPAVVFVHGYIPPLNYQTTEKYVDYVHSLARSGLVVFKIDLRGHGASEGAPNGAYYSGDYVIDVLNARASLATLSEVNPDKIGLWGHSMAGNVVLRAMVVEPTIHAGVIWAGAVYTYVDMREYGIEDASYQPSQNPQQGRRQEMYQAVGEPNSGSEFWEWVKPTNYLNDLEGRVQLHHASADPVVTVEYARNLKRLLDEAGVGSELFEYSSGGHNLSSPAFTEAMERSVAELK